MKIKYCYFLKTDFINNERIRLRTELSKDCNSLTTLFCAEEYKIEELNPFLLKRTNIEVNLIKSKILISEFFAVGYLDNIICNFDTLILNWKIEKVYSYYKKPDEILFKN